MLENFLAMAFYINYEDVIGSNPIEFIDPILVESLENTKYLLTPMLFQFFGKLSREELRQYLIKILPKSFQEMVRNEDNTIEIFFPNIIIMDKNANGYSIHLLNGTIDKEGYILRSIPKWARDLKEYREMFGNADLGQVKVNSNRLIEFNFKGETYRLFERESKGVFYKKISVLGVSSWYQLLQNVPNNYDTLPLYLRDRNYTFWIDLKQDLHGHRQVVIANATRGENCYVMLYKKILKLQNGMPVAEVQTTRGRSEKTQTNPLGVFNCFENWSFIEVLNYLGKNAGIMSTAIPVPLTINLLRYNLPFVLQANADGSHTVHCSRFLDYELNLDPVYDLIPGFSSYLEFNQNAGHENSFILIPKQAFVSKGPKKIDLDKQGLRIGDALLMSSGNPAADSYDYEMSTPLNGKDWSFRGQCGYFKISIKARMEWSTDKHGDMSLQRETREKYPHCMLLPQTSEEALYLCYITIANLDFEGALEYFDQYRGLGGLSGSAFEAELIQWFLEDVPYQLKSSKMRARMQNRIGNDAANITCTPALIALRAALLTDLLKYMTAQMNFVFQDKSLSGNEAFRKHQSENLRNYFTIEQFRRKITQVLFQYDQTSGNIPARFKLREEDRDFLESIAQITSKERQASLLQFTEVMKPLLLPKVQEAFDISFLANWEVLGHFIAVQDLKDKTKSIKTNDLLTSFEKYVRFLRGEMVEEFGVLNKTKKGDDSASIPMFAEIQWAAPIAETMAQSTGFNIGTVAEEEEELAKDAATDDYGDIDLGESRGFNEILKRNTALKVIKARLIAEVKAEHGYQHLGFNEEDPVNGLKNTGIVLSTSNCRHTLAIILLYVLEHPTQFMNVNLVKNIDNTACTNLQELITITKKLSTEKPILLPTLGFKQSSMAQQAVINQKEKASDLDTAMDLAEKMSDKLPDIDIKIPSVQQCLKTILEEMNINQELSHSLDRALARKRKASEDHMEDESPEKPFAEIDLKDYQEGRRQNEAIRRFKAETFEILSNRDLIARLKTKSSAILSTHVSKLQAIETRAESLLNQMPSSDFAAMITKLQRLGNENPILTIEDLRKHFLKGTLAKTLVQHAGVGSDTVEQLIKLLIEYLLIKTALQHHSRVLDGIRDLERDAQKMGKLSDIIFSERAYSAGEKPYLLAFEESENLLVRESQLHMLSLTSQKALQKSGFCSNIFQMLMGYGKTTVIVPISAYVNLLYSEDDNLVLQLMPKAILKTQRRDMAITAKRAFDLDVLPFRFHRSCDASLDSLENLLKYLKYAIKTRSPQAASHLDAPSLELKWIEMLCKKVWDEKAILVIEEILSIFKDRVDAFIDEIDTLLDIRKELNYTMDVPQKLRAETITTFLNIYSLFNEVKFQLLDPETLQPKGKEYRLSDVYASREFADLTAEEWSTLFDKAISHSFAEVLINSPKSCLRNIVDKIKLLDESGEKGLIAKLTLYISGKFEATEETVDERRIPLFLYECNLTMDEKHCIALCKEQISSLLPLTLRKKTGKNFGRPSKNSVKQNKLIDSEVACPYLANGKPSRNSEFASPYETLSYTIRMNKEKGITYEIFRAWIERMQHQANEEKGLFIGKISSIDETSIGQEFKRLNGLGLTLSSINIDDAKRMKELYKLLRKKREVVDYCLENHIGPRIKTNPRILRHTALNHTSMYRSIRGCSGTILSPFVFDERAEFDKESAFGVDGRTIDLLIRNNTKVSVATSTNPFASVSTLLQANENTRALIDVGAYFYGISNIKVAKWLADFCAKSESEHSKIKYVLYYNKQDVLCALKVGDASEKPIKLMRTNPESIRTRLGVGPEQCFTYYDEMRSTGTNIAQMTNAHAIVTIGTQTMQKDFLQGVMRMRDFEGTHRATVLVPKNMHEALGAPEWDIRKVLALTKKIQKSRVAEDNFRAAIFKLRDLVRSDLLCFLRNEKDWTKKRKIFDAMESILFSHSQDNPFESFGAVAGEELTSKVVKAEKDKLFLLWKNVRAIGEETLDVIHSGEFEAKLDLICLKAEKVCNKTVMLQGEISDTSVQTIAAANNEAALDLANINQAQREAERETSFLHYQTAPVPALMKLWPSDLNLSVTDIFREFRTSGQQMGSPMVYLLNDIMQGQKDLKNIVKFGIHTFVSANFLFTIKGQQNHLITPYIKPAHFALFVQNDREMTLEMLIITQDEALQFEKLFDLPMQSKALQEAEKYYWVVSPQNLLESGEPPNKLHQDYQYFLEQFWYINGDTQLFIKHCRNLQWLREDEKSKLDFYYRVILACRPDREESFATLQKYLAELRPGGHSAEDELLMTKKNKNQHAIDDISRPRELTLALNLQRQKHKSAAMKKPKIQLEAMAVDREAGKESEDHDISSKKNITRKFR